ncbi:MAG: porin [bacterium]
MAKTNVSRSAEIISFAMSVIVLFASTVSAEEPLMETLKKRFQSEPLTVGALIQVVGIYESADSAVVNNGFGLANFRVRLNGELDGGWGYFLQTSFIAGPALLDANVRYRPWTAVRFDMGALKAPFSAEFLLDAGSIDFVNRSQVVTLLAPGRQVGIAARGDVGMGFGYAVGAFNGNGLAISNDDNHLMAAGRISYGHGFENGGVTAGINAYQSNDTDAPIGAPITGDFIAGGFSGGRTAYGADARFTNRRWLATAEVIGSRYDPRGGSRVEPYGYQVTAGYEPTDRSQLLLRWDSFNGDGVVADSDLIILGLNYFPTSPTEAQANVVIPTSGGRDVQLLFNVQVAF